MLLFETSSCSKQDVTFPTPKKNRTTHKIHFMAQFQYVNILLFIVVGETLFISSWSYTKYYPRRLVSHKKKSQFCVWGSMFSRC